MATTNVQCVVIPGILGSQLSWILGGGAKAVVWPNPALLASLSPLSMALASDGKSPYPGVGLQLAPTGSVGFGIYESLISVLQPHVPNVYFWAYDWRLDLPTLANQLVAQLAQLRYALGTFHVVAHSMGGLIAQLAYPFWAQLGNSPQWVDTFYLNTPQGGAHWAAMALNGLYYDGAWMKLLGDIYDTTVYTTPPLQLLYEINAKLLGQAVGSWPSVYQLLPSNLGPWAGLDPLAGQALQASTYTAGPGGVQQQWLTQALTVQQQLVAGYSQPRPFEFNLNGILLPTPRAYCPGVAPQTLAGYLYTTDGDGTVPDERKGIPHTGEATFEGTSHNGICTSFVVLEQLWNWILNHPTGGADFNDVQENPKPFFISQPPAKNAPMETWAGDFAERSQDP